MSAADDFDKAILEFMQDDPLTVVYISSGTATFVPSTGANTFTSVETSTSGILLDLTASSSGLSTKFGTQIIAGDKELYLLPPEKLDTLRLPLVINTASDKVRIGTTEYKIVGMKECNPTAAAPLLYNFHIRR